MQELINYINDINHSLNDDSYVMNSVTSTFVSLLLASIMDESREIDSSRIV